MARHCKKGFANEAERSLLTGWDLIPRRRVRAAAHDPFRTCGLLIADCGSRPLSQPLAREGRKSYPEGLGLGGGARVSRAASPLARAPAVRTGTRKTRNNFVTDAGVVSTTCAISCFC